MHLALSPRRHLYEKKKKSHFNTILLTLCPSCHRISESKFLNALINLLSSMTVNHRQQKKKNTRIQSSLVSAQIWFLGRILGLANEKSLVFFFFCSHGVPQVGLSCTWHLDFLCLLTALCNVIQNFGRYFPPLEEASPEHSVRSDCKYTRVTWRVSRGCVWVGGVWGWFFIFSYTDHNSISSVNSEKCLTSSK